MNKLIGNALIVSSLATGVGTANAFTIDGVNFTVINETEVKVDMGSDPGTDETYVLPSTVSDGDNEYTVTELGMMAFSTCSFKHIMLPETLVKIGMMAFASCSNLEEIVMPNSVTSVANWAFYDCQALKSVTFSANLTVLSTGMFQGCGIENITIPGELRYIPASFMSGSKSLTTVTITDGLEEIGSSAFSYCDNLQSVTIPNSVTTIDEYAFFELPSLTRINLPEGLTEISEGAFSYCPALTEITIPSNVSEIGVKAFSMDSSLTAVNIPDNVVNIDQYAFWGCTGVKTFTIGAGVMDIASNALVYLNSCEGFHVSGDNSVYADIDGVLFSKNLDTLVMYACGKEADTYEIPTDVKSIAPEAFRYSRLTGVILPDCLEKIGDMAFYYSGLTDVEFPSTLTSIGHQAFQGAALKSVSLPETIDYLGKNVFAECVDLETAVYPATLIDTGESTFSKCVSLKEVVIPEGVEVIGRECFSWCSGLETLILPSTVNLISFSAFFNDTALKNICCLAEEPPTVDFYGFDGVDYENCILSVPEASITAYKEAPVWGNFAVIQGSTGVAELSDTAQGLCVELTNGLVSISAQKECAVAVYSLSGTLVYTSTGTNHAIELPAGIYILSIGERRVKIRI